MVRACGEGWQELLAWGVRTVQLPLLQQLLVLGGMLLSHKLLKSLGG